MDRYAQIKDGVVVSTLEASGEVDFPNMIQLCPETQSHIDIDWRYVNGEWLEPLPPNIAIGNSIPIDQARDLISARDFGIELTIEQEAAAQAAIVQSAGIQAEPNPDPGKPEMPWRSGEFVIIGSIRMFNDKEYICRQAHATQADWMPDITPALWTVHRLPTKPGDTLPWIEWETVAADDERSYEGEVYVCIIGHTTQPGWEPPRAPALWRLK